MENEMKKLSSDPKAVASVARMLRMLTAAGFIERDESAPRKYRLTHDGKKALFLLSCLPESAEILGLIPNE